MDKIIEEEKIYITDKSSKGLLGAMNKLANGVFSGLGFTDRDKALLKWFLPNSNKMTIFQYQKMIVDEMLMLLQVDDDTAENLAKMLNSVYESIKSQKQAGFTIGKVSTKYGYGGYTASFEVANKSGAPDTIFAPLRACMSEFIVSAQKGLFDFPKTETELEPYIKLLTALSSENLTDQAKRMGQEYIRRFGDGIVFTRYNYKKDKNDKPTTDKIGEYTYRLEYLANKCIVKVQYESEV